MPNSKVEISKHTGAEYEYDYQQIGEINEGTIAAYCAALRQRFNVQREMPEAAEQWIARTYISVKYLLAASVMLSSARFASARNLRIVEPYLLYYSLFNSSRAFFLMIPEQPWKNGGLLDDPTHSKVRNVVSDYLRYVSPSVADRYHEISGRALGAREIFSYKFPAQGLKGPFASILPELDDVIDLCQFVAEMAQLHSECLQKSFQSLPDIELPNTSAALEKVLQYEHKTLTNQIIIDDDDWYRIVQFVRHSNKPASLHLTARPGLVEEFFGAWTPDEKSGKIPDQYDADTDWRIIFDFS